MKLGTFVKWSFIISFLMTLLGAYLKLSHSKNAEIFLIIGIIATLAFIISTIYEIRTSNLIDNTEKTLWTIALILMSGPTGLIYFFIGRKRIMKNS